MDDEEIFGGEIYTLNFERAIALDLLSDYKVIILAVRKENLSGVTNSVNKKISQLEAKGTKLDKKLINNEFVCKIIGTHKGLANQDIIALDDENKEDNDLQNKKDAIASQRAISFCKSIDTSKRIKDSFETIMECYDEELKKKSFKNLQISIDHIDGTMNCKVRLEKLEELNEFQPNTCKVLSNARCLSEGVDVPALDSIIFFDGKSAMVDIIQAVGRVMRKAKRKQRGYIILPIALEESEIKNLDEAVNNTNFKNIWKVLKALRSHDPSLVDEATFKEKIKIFGSDDEKPIDDGEACDEKPQKDKTEPSDPKQAQKTLFDAILLQDLADAVYNVMPTKLGDRNYWENFTKKTGNIARTLNNRLKMIFDKNPEIFSNFLDSLRVNIHQSIKEDEALDMITSHIITKPIFDALFGDNIQNPIAKALDKMVQKLATLGLEGETKDLKNLYESVKTEALRTKSQKSQQELIKNLYNTFFKEAFRKQSEKLGIVYTPIEVVDFILRATNGILKKHFNTDFNDKNITIFDPFTGTGSFIARLLSKETRLISDEALKEKFSNHLFAFDIVLLSYYIALINITQAAQNRDSSLKFFKNIALTDSLDIYEKKNDKGVLPPFLEDLKENKEIKSTIEKQNIRVIIGNPPYSAGAKSENDNNQNLFNKQWLYWDKDLIHRQCQFSKIFPNKHAQNVVINTGAGNGKDFSALVSDFISDCILISPNQAYPLYCYDDLGRRDYAISGWALNLFRKHYEDNSITEEEIFYYIYAILHHKGYLEKYKNSLKKEAPRTALSPDFKELSVLGKQLAELHLNYESGEMHDSVEYNLLESAEIEGYYDVEKMTKKGDSILYNKNIAITKIPDKAFEYVVNGKSAIDWVIERYQKTTDKESLIENNPNDYAGGKYILELLCRVIKLSEKSVDLIEKISEKRFE
ncbi:hypothetical protein KKKH38_07420 [Helicobacter pylori]